MYIGAAQETQKQWQTQLQTESGKKAAKLFFIPEDFDGSKVAEYDAIAFGCPAMGDEVLEDTEFEPMFDGCKDALKGKNIALFGSYGWGDGEWMRNWEESCKEAGANLVCDSVICQEEPDDEATDACKALGAALV